MKHFIITASAGVVGFFTSFSVATQMLLVFLMVDYMTGLFVAIDNKSTKSKSGGFNSSVGFKGILKKISIILLLGCVAYLDKHFNTTFYTIFTVAFAFNEFSSILENMGLMGIPIPNKVKKALDILQEDGKE